MAKRRRMRRRHFASAEDYLIIGGSSPYDEDDHGSPARGEYTSASAAAKLRARLMRMSKRKAPCVRKSGRHEGKLKPGYKFGPGGICVKSGHKARHRQRKMPCVSRSTGKLKKGWRFGKSGRCIKARG